MKEMIYLHLTMPKIKLNKVVFFFQLLKACETPAPKTTFSTHRVNNLRRLQITDDNSTTNGRHNLGKHCIWNNNVYIFFFLI